MLFEKDPKKKVDEILDRLDVNNEMRTRKEILRSIKRQHGEIATMEHQMATMASVAVLTFIGMVGAKLINKYFCDKF